jgi:membrane associated rhomboid family serine protease
MTNYTGRQRGIRVSFHPFAQTPLFIISVKPYHAAGEGPRAASIRGHMVFPLYDDNPFKLQRPPIVTWALIAVNIIIFLFEIGSDETAKAILASFAANPAAITRDIQTTGPIPPEVTLLTSMFLHGGWGHLLGNMVYLWVFGDDIEEALGPLRFLIFYLLCGIIAALVFVAFNMHSNTPLIGASGAISGVLAAYLLLRPCARVTVFVLRVVVRVRAYWVIGAWALLQIFLLAQHSDDDAVAYLAHVGGLAAGAILFLVMRPAGVELFECVDPADKPAAAR